jgi:hypothetical protein
MLHNFATDRQRMGKNTPNYPHFRRSRRARFTKAKKQGEAMQIFRPIDYVPATLVGRGLRVLLTGAHADSPVAEKLARLGGAVEVETEAFMALSLVMDDPHGYSLFVIDADGLGGNDEAQRICGLLKGAFPRLPVIIVGGHAGEQSFPEDAERPVRLRAPVSAVSLRVGFEHALRDRMMWENA